MLTLTLVSDVSVALDVAAPNATTARHIAMEVSFAFTVSISMLDDHVETKAVRLLERE
jgi:hypothetical protein